LGDGGGEDEEVVLAELTERGTQHSDQVIKILPCLSFLPSLPTLYPTTTMSGIRGHLPKEQIEAYSELHPKARHLLFSYGTAGFRTL
jgi:hypothetical protein